MQIWEIRHKQWEIADSISTYLKTGKIVVGNVKEIIQICNIKSDGHFVGKFLQRSESMPHSPFIIRRVIEKEIPYHGLTYRIALKTSDF
jgi:hypothetical protein